jgi:hypothetical protein
MCSVLKQTIQFVVMVIAILIGTAQSQAGVIIRVEQSVIIRDPLGGQIFYTDTGPPFPLFTAASSPFGLSLDGSRSAFAAATTNITSGIVKTAVAVDGFYQIPPNGGGSFDQQSQTQLELTVTNDLPTPVAFRFGFAVTPPTLILKDYYGVDVDDFDDFNTPPLASYFFSVRQLEPSPTDLWFSQANLKGGIFGHRLEELGVDLGGRLIFPADNTFGYEFGPALVQLDPIILGGGAQTKILTTMRTTIFSPIVFGVGGHASIGDPTNLDGSPGFQAFVSTSPLQPIPEPSSFAIFGIGALGLVGIGVRRKRKPQA